MNNEQFYDSEALRGEGRKEKKEKRRENRREKIEKQF
jgi:hypothetical protein